MNEDIDEAEALRCLVVLGVTDGLERLVQKGLGGRNPWIDFNDYDFVIAADSGQRIARNLGLKTDIYVGDFDSSIRPDGMLKRSDGKTRTVEDLGSLSPSRLRPSEYTFDGTEMNSLGDAERDMLNQEPFASEIVILPEVKDITDSEAAIDLAFERGFRRIDVLGGISGRLDHTLGNLGILVKYLGKAHIRFFDGINIVSLLSPGDYRVESKGYRYLGLIAFGTDVRGLDLVGTKYEVHDFTLPQATTRGVSNEIIADKMELTFREGLLLVINSRD